MKKIMFLLVVCVLTFAYKSYAEEYKHSLTFGVYTYHYSDGDYTEGIENRLIAIEWNGLALADFVNSYGRETQFVGYGWHTKKFYAKDSTHLWVRGNAYLGALLGYGHDHPVHLGVLSPGAYPTGNIGYDNYSVEVGLMPGFVWTGLKVEF